MSLEDAMAQALEQLPQSLAVDYVDMRSGRLLAAATERRYSPDLFAELSLRMGNLSQGSHITHLMDILQRPVRRDAVALAPSGRDCP